MRIYITILTLIFAVSFVYACAKPKGYSPESKRAYVRKMKDDTLAELYAKKPETKELVENAAGYGVFSNISTLILVAGAGNGYGIILDNSNDKETFMKMAEGAVGLGVGVTDMRQVFIFNSPIVLTEFISKGWDFGVQGDAVLKSKTMGGAATGQLRFESDIIVYQITDQGISLLTNLGADKYWIDSELNYY